MRERRGPIYLGHQAIALVSIYNKYSDCLDIALSDFLIYQKPHQEWAEEGARELMNHLADDCNLLFLRALKAEVEKEIEKRESLRTSTETGEK